MANESPVNDLTQEEYDFIAAVLEDENAEYPLDDEEEYILFTDWEGDGEFWPSVTILHSVSEDEQDEEKERISSLLEEVDWFEFDEMDSIDNDGSGDMAHAYFYGARIDHDMGEQVQMSL